MNLFVSSVVVPASHLPIQVAAAQESLAAAVVEEIERIHLWRAVVRQERRILIDGPLDHRLELEPVADVLSITRWTPTDAAEVIPASSYSVVTRESGTIIAPSPGSAWPTPFRLHGSFDVNYLAGWIVSANENNVPPSVQLMIERAIEYRAGGSGFEAIRIGPLEMDQAPSYSTDRLPAAIASIGAAFAYRTGLFAGRP